jgi:hypothetical protein
VRSVTIAALTAGTITTTAVTRGAMFRKTGGVSSSETDRRPHIAPSMLQNQSDRANPNPATNPQPKEWPSNGLACPVVGVLNIRIGNGPAARGALLS